MASVHKNILLVVALLTWAGGVLGGEECEGEVLGVGENVLMLMIHDGQQLFVIEPTTTIVFEGKPAQLHDIAAGHRALVIAELRNDQYVATLVLARSAY